MYFLSAIILEPVSVEPVSRQKYCDAGGANTLWYWKAILKLQIEVPTEKINSKYFFRPFEKKLVSAAF